MPRRAAADEEGDLTWSTTKTLGRLSGWDDVSASTAPGTLRVRATHDGKVFLQRRARDGAVLAHLVLTPDEAVKMLGVTLFAVLQQGVNPPSLDDVRACLQAASAQDPF